MSGRIIPVNEKCPDCKGSGWEAAPWIKLPGGVAFECGKCNGTGRYKEGDDSKQQEEK